MSLCIVTLNVNGIAVVSVEKRKLISCVYKKHNVLLILNQNWKTEREWGERKYLERNDLIDAINKCYTFGRATFKNSSVISWMSVLLVEGTRGPGENHQPAASHCQTLSHNVVRLALITLISSVVIGTDCIGSCKSNYHTINATTASLSNC